MGCKLFYKIIEIFIIVKILVVLYPSMVIQEKRKNLEGSFLDLWWLKKKEGFLEVLVLRSMAAQ